MAPSPRLRLADLVTEYLLHVDRRHLYVEGQDDRAVLEWFLDSMSINNVRVLEIDCIEITAEDLRRHGLDEGSKSRVRVLARELDNALLETTPKVLCVVDADFDYILDRIETNRFLANTDGTSLEMYAFSIAPLKRILRLGFRDSASDPARILKELYGVLREIFVTRAANEALKWGLEWLPFERRCRVELNGKISFDINRFVRDYLSKNNEVARGQDFSRCRLELLTRTMNSPWKCVRGHDYANLLSRYLGKICRTKEAKEITRGATVIRMVFVALDPKELLSAPLFQRIVSIFAPS